MRTTLTLIAVALIGASAPSADPLARLTLASLCSAGAVAPVATATDFRPRRVDGFGVGGLSINANAEARVWFDYGLQNAWAFNHRGAVEAFKEAQRLDPSCAMCVWGEAWAGGPTINFGVDAETARTLLARVDAAQALAGPESATNRALIEALRRRYSGSERRRANAFADAMVTLADEAPDDDTLQVLAADAEMAAQRGPDRAMRRLERVLARAPEHTGAIHFYIHAAEWAGENEKAAPYAARLGSLAPAASHLIHMPSHTFYRLGRYREAGEANLAAVRADQRYLDGSGWDTPLADLPYHDHNVHFGMGGALMAGDRGVALELARHFETTWTAREEQPSFREVLMAAALIARARHADPQEALAAAEPQGGPFIHAMWRYARGEAFARLGDSAAMSREVAAMRLQSGAFSVYGDMRDEALKLARIARDVLAGRTAMLSGRPEEARRAYLRAARLQERAFRLGDPPLFWYPVRRSVAAALLAAQRPGEAAAEARRVLEDWPDDPLTLVVLARAERALGDTGTAEMHETAARAGWSGDLSAVDERAI